jgi:hypothetical protein
MPSKAKNKAHRKAIREAEARAYLKRKKAIEKWRKEWFEGRSDYPVTSSTKKLTWNQIKKLINR